MSIIKRMISSRTDLAKEYEQVNSIPCVKYIIEAAVVAVDLFVMFVLIWNTITYVIQPGSWINIVDGDSMNPTMLNGQIVYTDTSSGIDRGDIITTHLPEYVINEKPEAKDLILIKRVVGVPGDRLIINKDGVYINGELLVEDYLTDEAVNSTYVENKCNSVLLESGEYFVMGDNRGNSYDSRSFGVVTRENILYEQSARPTNNFYLKLAFLVLIFVLDVFLYALIEFVLTECAYGILFKRVGKKN